MARLFFVIDFFLLLPFFDSKLYNNFSGIFEEKSPIPSGLCVGVVGVVVGVLSRISQERN